MMDDEFGESLPSESLLVPHSSPRHTKSSRSIQKTGITKQPFLQKGSRQEPSALMAMRKKNSSNSTAPHMRHDDPTVPDLETSLISNSDLLSETTNSDIQKKYLEDRRHAQLELDEFEKIERDLDNIAVSPLLMSTDSKLPKYTPGAADRNQNETFERYGQETVNSAWNNKPAGYYMGAEPSIRNSRNSQSSSSNRYQNSYISVSENIDKEDLEEGDDGIYHQDNGDGDDDNENEVEDEDYHDEDDGGDHIEHNRNHGHRHNYSHSQRHSDDDQYLTSEVDLPLHSDSDDDDNNHELHEAASTALIAETHFIRVSQSQNPFLSPKQQHSSPFPREKFPQEGSKNMNHSIDDSVSWANSSNPPQTAIRPRLSEESTRNSHTPVSSRHSPAPPRYQTSNHSTGAIGDSNSEWNTNRKSLTRPSSTTSPKHHPHHHSNPHQTPPPTRQQNQTRKSTDRPVTTNHESSKSRVILDEEILEKAKKLENEIALYQKENSHIKSLKKQHEAALAEIQEQRSQLKIWIEEEKKKTEKWCEDMKDSARKEKRAAAQYMRDVRNSSSGTSIRKEKAEIEALQATITKLTLEYNETTKKLKANIARLQQTNKSQTEQIHQLENQVATLELEKMRITLQGNSKSHSLKNNSKLRESDMSYAVEVNVLEEKIHNSSHVSDSMVLVQTNGGRQNEKNPIQKRSNQLYRGSDDDGHGHGDEDDYEEEEEEGDEEEEYSGIGNEENDQDQDQDRDHDEDQDRDNEKDDYDRNHGRLDASHERYQDNLAPHGQSHDQSPPGHTNIKNQTRVPDRSHENNSTGYEVYHDDYHLQYLNNDDKSYDPKRYHASHAPQAPHASLDSTTELPKMSATNRQKSSNSSVDTLGRASQTGSSTSVMESQNIIKSTIQTNKSSENTATTVQPNPGKDRKIEISSDGVKITRYSNGTVKYQHTDGTTEVRFTNGDIKTQNPKDSTLVYFYAQAKTTHTTYADGTEVYSFPTGQIEKHFPNGRKVVTFPDKTIKTIYSDGYQESVFPDGVVVKEYPGGKREIIEPTHQKS